jgi:hypothetical protein
MARKSGIGTLPESDTPVLFPQQYQCWVEANGFRNLDPHRQTFKQSAQPVFAEPPSGLARARAAISAVFTSKYVYKGGT